ncbi:MAG: hypothetical protein JW388_0734 [Nitrospira sp.]|nr:hypothetical protein [Nitrospira sp.]
MFICEAGRDFCQHTGHLVGLDGEHQHRASIGHGAIGVGHTRARLFSKCGAGCGHHIACDQLSRRNDAGANAAFGQCRGHFACAQKPDGESCCHARFVTGRTPAQKNFLARERA